MNNNGNNFNNRNNNNNVNRNNGGNNNNNNNNGGQRAKMSGATFSLIKEGKSKGMLSVNAWLKGRNGLVRISAFGYDTVKGKNCTFQKAVAEVTNMTSMSTSKYAVLINETTKRMSIKELNLLVTAKGGGYTSTGKRVTGAVVRLA